MKNCEHKNIKKEKVESYVMYVPTTFLPVKCVSHTIKCKDCNDILKGLYYNNGLNKKINII